MHIAFCADRKVLPGLHVAAFSLLDRLGSDATDVCFHLFSDDLGEQDVALLEQTLRSVGKAFTLRWHRLDAAQFRNFPILNGSLATYYRLLVPQTLEVERFLYVDADTLCDVDVAPLQTFDLGDAPAAWVPEAPLRGAGDRYVAEQLGDGPDDFYFNAGIILVNVAAWRAQRITEQTLDYLGANPAMFWDQSALNYVLHGRARLLDARFNCISNLRPNWDALRRPYGQIGRLVHFLDYPKPWDFCGEFFHPFSGLWRSVLRRTALKDFRSWQPTPARRFPQDLASLKRHQKTLKDRVLFGGYSRGWLRRVKGMPCAL